MYEIFEVQSGEVICIVHTEEQAEKWIEPWNDLDYRIAEDRWPEYESVMEMEKYQ